MCSGSRKLQAPWSHRRARGTGLDQLRLIQRCAFTGGIVGRVQVGQVLGDQGLLVVAVKLQLGQALAQCRAALGLRLPGAVTAIHRQGGGLNGVILFVDLVQRIDGILALSEPAVQPGDNLGSGICSPCR